MIPQAWMITNILNTSYIVINFKRTLSYHLITLYFDKELFFLKQRSCFYALLSSLVFKIVLPLKTKLEKFINIDILFNRYFIRVIHYGDISSFIVFY